MATLFLDIGNSHIKLAEKQGVTWEVVFKASNSSLEGLTEVVEEYPDINLMVVCSVREDALKKILDVLSFINVKVLTSSLIDSVSLDYETPDTLGMDRFLTCYGAVSVTDHDVICVDAGTACTVDWMTNEGIYRGGVIMPGLKLFHEMMERKLPELPSVDYYIPTQWPGKSTKQSVQWGTSGSYLAAIDGFIRKYLEIIEGDTDLFLTGGDSLYLSENLDSSLKVHHRPHLLFDGMEMFWKDLERLD